MTSKKRTGRQQAFAQLPQVDRLSLHPDISKLMQQFPRQLVIDQLREQLEKLRLQLTEMPPEQLATFQLDQEALVDRFVREISRALAPKVRRVINATGIILHTGLGRAPLPKQAQQSLIAATEGYSSVEIDLETGKRGDRHQLVEALLKKLTGAEAAAVVNNNAAATLLALNTLSFGKETIVSRGELVTIGGSYRIPDIMKKSGAQMVEVGTTNQTELWEYEQAITENTGLLLKVHTSNYRIIGFVAEASLPELVQLGRKRGLPVMHDLGSGMLIDLSRYGLPKEPVVGESLACGADIVTFSGDKLLGGPQAGIIVGKKKYIDLIKKNQLARALRCGKLTFAALEATLRLFLDPDKLLQQHPVLTMLLRDESDLDRAANELQQRLAPIVADLGEVQIEMGLSEVGGGSLATESLPTRLVRLQLHQFPAEVLAKRLRLNDPPIVARIVDNRIALDVRTIRPDEFDAIAAAVSQILNGE